MSFLLKVQVFRGIIGDITFENIRPITRSVDRSRPVFSILTAQLVGSGLRELHHKLRKKLSEAQPDGDAGLKQKSR